MTDSKNEVGQFFSDFSDDWDTLYGEKKSFNEKIRFYFSKGCLSEVRTNF